MIKINQVYNMFENRKQILINNYLRIGLVAIITIAMISISYFIYITYKDQKYVEKKHLLYSCTNKADVYYDVVMIPNEIFNEENIKGSSLYVTKLVDYINTTFKYQLNSQDIVGVKGKYNVKAVLEGYIMNDDGGKRSIFKKDYIIQPETSFEGNDKVISFENKNPISIKNYRDYAISICRELGLNFNNKLTVVWDAEVEVKTPKGTVNEKITPVMEILLSDNFFEVKGSLSQEKESKIEETKKEVAANYTEKIIISWFAQIISIGVLFLLIFFTKPIVIKDPIQKKLNLMLKEHGSRMAVLNGELPVTPNELIEVSSIDDLVKIADDIGRPVLFNNNYPEEIPKFYVVDKGNIYFFDLAKDISDTFRNEPGNISC